MALFKLDENLSVHAGSPLTAAGHGVHTVADEKLGGANDPEIAEACKREQRCLITADLDFAQILDYPPERYAGIIVLRHPEASLEGMVALVAQIVEALATESPVGRLWIVEPGRLRIHDPGDG